MCIRDRFKDQALDRQRIVLTKFLNPYHQSIVHSVIGKSDELIVLENGGFINSEAKRMIIAPAYYQIEQDDFEIVLVKITYAKPVSYTHLGPIKMEKTQL